MSDGVWMDANSDSDGGNVDDGIRIVLLSPQWGYIWRNY